MMSHDDLGCPSSGDQPILELGADEEAFQDIYPLTPMQEGLLFHALAQPGHGAYHQQYLIRLASCDPKRLALSWRTVIQHHPALRTSFAWVGLEQPLQLVHPRFELDLVCRDLSDMPQDQLPAYIHSFLEEDRQRCFDLSSDRLMRVTLFKATQDVMIWSFHHLILDGWSAALVLRDLFLSYSGQTLFPVRPFADYVFWLQQNRHDASKAFWEKELKGMGRPTPLPVKSASLSSAPRPKSEWVPLSPDLCLRLTQFQQERGYTLNTLAQAAWSVLLSRISGNDVVVFGQTFSTRPPALAQSDRIVGLLINTIPVRLDVSVSSTMAQFLDHIQDRQVLLERHNQSCLVDIHKASALPAGVPLFESLVVVENFPVDLAAFDDLVAGVEVHEQTQYPLVLVVLPEKDRFKAQLMYRPDLLDAAVAKMLAQGFARILAQLPQSNSPQSLSPFPNPLTRQAPSTPDVPLVTSQILVLAKQNPDATALVLSFPDGTSHSWSRSNLVQRAAAIAEAVPSSGMDDTPLGVCLEPGLDLYATLLAALMLGRPYLPLDPVWPLERMNLILSDAGAGLVLTSTSFADRVNQFNFFCLDQQSQPNKPWNQDAAHPQQGAYLIYTSGSTGHPKGVLVTHQNLACHVSCMKTAYQLTAEDRVLQFTSPAFDVAAEEVWPTLCAGGTVVRAASPIADMSTFLDRNQITVANIPVSFWHEWVFQLSRRFRPLPPKLRLVICGTEPIQPDRFNWWHDHFQIPWIHAYGCTETTITTSLFKPDGAPVYHDPLTIPVGSPLPNADVYILSDDLSPLPVGRLGALFIGGFGVSRGYVSNPGFTAARFIPDPFSRRAGARMYQTGDRVRCLPDGNLVFHGRLDHQLKLRGHRIEPAEIEAALGSHPRVQEAAVISIDSQDGPLLAAYAAGEGLSVSDVDELLTHLQRKLPKVMVPTHLTVLPSLPKLPNHKLDRGALPTPKSTTSSAAHFVAPRNEIENLCAKLWAQCLNQPEIGVHDDFFVLGGHSLTATRVVAALLDVFDIQIPLKALFDHPTVASFASFLSQQLTGQFKRDLIPRVGSSESPLSFAQQRLWVLCQLPESAGAYNIASGLFLHGHLDQTALHQSFATMVSRHPILATVFVQSQDQPMACFQPNAAPKLQFLDLSHLTEPRRPALDHASQQAAIPFNLETGPLTRACLTKLSNQEHLLSVCMHHMVSDHHSLSIMIQELTCHYRNLTGDNATSSLPEKPFHYADFARFQRALDHQGVFKNQLAYWTKTLRGMPASHRLPVDHTRRGVPSHRGARIPVDLGETLTAAVQAFCADLHVTPFMVLETAFAALLCRYQGRSDMPIGTAVTHRNRRELEQAIGFFANTIILRNDFRQSDDPIHGPDFESMVCHVRGRVLEAVANSDVPFEHVIQALQPDRDANVSPLFQIAFTLYSGSDMSVTLPGLSAEPVEIDPQTAKFDLLLALSEASQNISGVLEFALDLFQPVTIQRLARHFLTLLEQVLKQPELRLNQIPLWSESERLEWLSREHHHRKTFSPKQSLVACFEAAVDENPNAEALIWVDERTNRRRFKTYAELDQAANRVARLLAKHGVSHGDLVALWFERGFEMIEAVLGVLKAGAAYLPLDPMYPAQRVMLILEDARCSLLLSDQKHNLTTPGLTTLNPASDHRLQALSSLRLDRRILPEMTAYVIYTSGSTGRPKGVPVSHGGVYRLFQAASSQFQFSKTDTWSMFHSLAFDFSVWEVWGALLHGARLVIVPFSISRDPQAFSALLKDEAVTVLNQTPSAFYRLSQEVGAEQFTALRWIIFGGEALDPTKLKPWFEGRMKVGPQLVNMYGITETIVHVTSRPMSSADVLDARSKIGRPLPDLGLFILDAAKQPVPIGVVGELHVAGAGLTGGYLFAPALAASRFIPLPDHLRHPMEPPGARLYQTGDLARCLPHGELQYLGRADQQIKVRGFRIEIGEIESALNQVEHLSGAAVTHHPRHGIVAYIKPHPDVEPEACRLARLQQSERFPHELRRTLPNGMVVAHAVHSEVEFLYKEIFEHNTYFRHGIHLKPGACILDVGAHVGMASLFFADHLSDYTIIAAEPIPPLFQSLLLNVEIHDLNLTALNVGVGAKPGSATFNFYPNVSVISGRYASEAEEREVVRTFLEHQVSDKDIDLNDLLSSRLQSECFDCPITTVSQIIADQHLTRIDLLKIDAEKSELDVLLGILPSDRPKIQQMVIEVHDAQGRLNAITSMLQEWGFGVQIEQDDSLQGTGLFNLYAVRTSNNQPTPSGGRLAQRTVAGLFEDVRSNLTEKLPYYMVPGRFVLLDQFPLTTNGKLDRDALPPPITEAEIQPFQPPNTPTEKALAQIWSEVLKQPRIGINTDFFQAGGHSIPATRVLARIRSVFGITLPPRYMFDEPTIRKLAHRIDMVLEVHRQNQMVEPSLCEEEEIEF